MDISMDISMDIHIHGKPAYWLSTDMKNTDLGCP